MIYLVPRVKRVAMPKIIAPPTQKKIIIPMPMEAPIAVPALSASLAAYYIDYQQNSFRQ